MPEVERPEFRKDAKPTERSLKGKGVGGLPHFVKLTKRSISGINVDEYKKSAVFCKQRILILKTNKR